MDICKHVWASLLAQMVKNPPAMQETQVSSLSREDPLEKGMTTQNSCLENSMDGGGWQATVHGVAKGRTGLRDFTSLTTHIHASKGKKKEKNQQD